MKSDRPMVQGLITATSVGAFAGMALVGWLLFFDISSIGTMVQSGTTSPLFSTLVIGGSLLKGSLLGFAFGLASSSIQVKTSARGHASVATRAAHV